MFMGLRLLSCCFLGLSLLAGCDNHYATRMALTKRATAATKETADLLATVRDQASAAAAAPKLKDLTARMRTIDEEFEALDTEDELYLGAENVVLAEHGNWLVEHTRLMQEEARIGQNAELRTALGDAWTGLTGGMFDPGGPLSGLPVVPTTPEGSAS
jgi:hypothetical protein